MPKSTFQESVNSVVSQMTVDEDGNSKLPDIDMTEEVRYTATLEKRRRDTQAALTREQQNGKAARAEADHLAKGWQESAKLALTTEQEAELEELKHSDPEAWRVKLNDFEQINKSKFEETRTDIVTKAKQESELERRTRMMEEFNVANPTVKITDDFIATEVPPKYLKQLEAGTISFEDFINTCANYATKDKVLDQGNAAPGTPNLSKAGGGHIPAEADRSADSVDSYKKAVF